MDLDFTALDPSERYWYLCSFVGPRPIALVTTVSASGQRNAAPMSFFNVVSHEPPILVLGIQRRRDGTLKDTAANIHEVGEFVVNMVDRSIADQMVQCGIDHPTDVDEVGESGLAWARSTAVAPWRIRQAPCSFECRLERTIDFAGRTVYFGEVVHLHVRDGLHDPVSRRMVEGAYRPIARLHEDNYVEAADQFVLSHSDDAPAR
jgi:flavin reductase (DIM6/NTAB) family NADH-FMN oxidoreductase RutF